MGGVGVGNLGKIGVASSVPAELLSPASHEVIAESPQKVGEQPSSRTDAISTHLQIGMTTSILTSAGGRGSDMRRPFIGAVSQLDRISPGLLLFLSSFTVLVTGFAVLQYLTPDSDFSKEMVRKTTETANAAPFLGQIRNLEGQIFTLGNIAKEPWLYGAGHVLPA